MKEQKIAIVRLKGNPRLKVTIRKTFELLRLYKKCHCVVLPNTPQYIGMLEKIKDAATWGEIDKATFKMLLEKRGRLPGNNILTEQYVQDKLKLSFDQFADEFLSFKRDLKDIPGIKLYFKLRPPIHGFESKGLKAQFAMGGSLGYRKDRINELITRMI